MKPRHRRRLEEMVKELQVIADEELAEFECLSFKDENGEKGELLDGNVTALHEAIDAINDVQ